MKESYPQRLRGELLALVIDSRYGDIDRIKTVQQAEKAITELIVESLSPDLDEDGSTGKWVNGWNERGDSVRSLWEPSKEGE